MLAELTAQASGAVAIAKRPIDIEYLLHWAYAQTTYVEYRNGSTRTLAFNHDYSAIPKGCHSLFAGADVSVTMLRSSAEDAKLLVAAVDALDPWTRAIVSRCAKNQSRPDCFAGVEAREVEVKTYPKVRGKRRKRKSHKPIVTKRWEPCHPMAICAARETYGRWHVAVARLYDALDGQLNDWKITGFAAPETPWLDGI